MDEWPVCFGDTTLSAFASSPGIVISDVEGLLATLAIHTNRHVNDSLTSQPIRFIKESNNAAKAKAYSHKTIRYKCC